MAYRFLPGLESLHRWIATLPKRGIDPLHDDVVDFAALVKGGFSESLMDGFRQSSSGPGDGTRAPGASWASPAATTRIGPGFAMSSATRAASFPAIRVFMTPSSNSESHRHLGGSRWPTSAPDRRDGFRTRGGVFRSHRCSRRPRSLQDEMQKARRARLRLPSSPASQEPSRRATASQPHADSRLLQPYSVRA
jgi:hypothetical protein